MSYFVVRRVVLSGSLICLYCESVTDGSPTWQEYPHRETLTVRALEWTRVCKGGAIHSHIWWCSLGLWGLILRLWTISSQLVNCDGSASAERTKMWLYTQGLHIALAILPRSCVWCYYSEHGSESLTAVHYCSTCNYIPVEGLCVYIVTSWIWWGILRHVSSICVYWFS